MAVVNYDSELRRAGAHATHGWRRLTFLAKRYVLGTIGLTIMLLFVWTAIFADFICRFDPLTVDSAHRLASPSLLHWMGTDSFGRDVWSRIVHGARISLIPIDFAASTNGNSRSASVLARMTRATVGISGMAIARITLGNEGPSAAVITNARTSNGNACNMSVTRWNTRSTQPER